MLSWRNAPTVRANMYTRHEISLTEHKAWWAKTSKRADQRYCMYEFQGRPLGIVAFKDIDTVHNISSWAFFASPDAPKGTGGKMEWLALDLAFREMRLCELKCEVLAHNLPVIKLHKKFGFIIKGVLREHYKSDEGTVDIYQLAILNDEWEARRLDMLETIVRLSNRKRIDYEPKTHDRQSADRH